MAHEGLHESEEKLAPATMDAHRAILSLMEEFEAVDWYHQRADACNDEELRAILLRNMHEVRSDCRQGQRFFPLPGAGPWHAHRTLG
ncbi:MAG: hypothetical protein K8H75_18295 [Sulfuricella sp.]|nr:hypothetical protein [Sulfuricella sp.]